MKNKSEIRGFFLRAGLVAVCVVVIVIALPRRGSVNWLYSEGHPWKNPDLVSKYDFPVFMDSVEKRHVLDSLLRKRSPYYVLRGDIKDRVLADFDAKVGGEDCVVPEVARNRIRDLLREIYDHGVVDAESFRLLARDTTSGIRLVRERNVVNVRLGDIYSTVSAYQLLSGDSLIGRYRGELGGVDLQEFITANLMDDVSRNRVETDEIEGSLLVAKYYVEKDSKIIDKGEYIDHEKFLKIRAYEQEVNHHNTSIASLPRAVAGQTLYVLVFMVLLTVYIALFRRDYFEKPRQLLLLYILVTCFPVAVSLMSRFTLFSVYVLPFAVVPMFIRVFMDSRTAFVGHVIMVLICAIGVTYQYEFIIMEIGAGAVAICSMRHLTQRSEVFMSAAWVVLCTSLIYTALQLMQENMFGTVLDETIYYYLIVNGVLLLFAYPAMYIVEKVFGFISDVTLIELSNTSGSLLRRMSQEVPGTFQHCIQVSNLAAEVAERIGAQVLLVRTGALYHDIGKMQNPAIYTENQKNGVNPLAAMDRKKAAKLIISHVAEGVRIAEREGLPSEIIDFIKTHHGVGLAKFFYINYRNEHADEEIDKGDFSYKGPKPQTKEQAILMMADAVEAASRSLRDFSEGSIGEMVNGIVDGQLQEGCFAEAPLNFRDITEAKLVMIERLSSINHTRIEYPKE